MSKEAELEQRLLLGQPLEREWAASMLAEHGTSGHHVLGRIVTAQDVDESIRVTAIRHLSPVGNEAVLQAVLDDASPVLRCWALRKAAEARAVSLLPRIEKMLADNARYFDLDEPVVVSDVAKMVIGILKGE